MPKSAPGTAPRTNPLDPDPLFAIQRQALGAALGVGMDPDAPVGVDDAVKRNAFGPGQAFVTRLAEDAGDALRRHASPARCPRDPPIRGHPPPRNRECEGEDAGGEGGGHLIGINQ